MSGLVESFAKSLDWQIRKCNVIVEGTSDVALLWQSAALFYERHQTVILGDQLAIIAAGRGHEGGVDGVNRRLNAARQIADVDRAADGSLRYRFVGLYDNDRAGRRGIDNACNFDRRLNRCGDLFLLSPVMPLASGADHAVLRRRFETENAPYQGLDWELEDLLSERLLGEFEKQMPQGIERKKEAGGRHHRDYSDEGKRELHNFIKKNANLSDVTEVIKLIRALRDYFGLDIGHIKI